MYYMYIKNTSLQSTAISPSIRVQMIWLIDVLIWWNIPIDWSKGTLVHILIRGLVHVHVKILINVLILIHILLFVNVLYFYSKTENISTQ